MVCPTLAILLVPRPLRLFLQSQELSPFTRGVVLATELGIYGSQRNACLRIGRVQQLGALQFARPRLQISALRQHPPQNHVTPQPVPINLFPFPTLRPSLSPSAPPH